MNFENACRICYQYFMEKENVGIGEIRDCGEFWIFFHYAEEFEYGLPPMIIYKNDEIPIEVTFQMFLQLSEVIQTGKVIDVPNQYKK